MSDWLISSKLSYVDEFKSAGFIVILLDGNIFIMGINGNELGVNECPMQRTTAEMGGNTSVLSTF